MPEVRNVEVEVHGQAGGADGLGGGAGVWLPPDPGRHHINVANESTYASPRIDSFWMVADNGRAALIACAVLLAEAVAYGDMLMIETCHSDRWAALARIGGRDL